MITYKKGNIFESEAEALVNTVNCVGVMGRGIALQCKRAYPENFKKYILACKRGEITPGKMFVCDMQTLMNPRYIINFPTKRHWKFASKIEDIESGLKDFVLTVRRLNIKSVVMPPLGCGLGGLNWDIVKDRIAKELSILSDVNIIVYEPAGAPDAKRQVRNKEVPRMTSGRAALVVLIARYLDGVLDPFITLLEVHKLMYFMQVAGEPLRLKYQKAPYGPYSENLRHVLKVIEGYFILGYADGGDSPKKQLSLIAGALDEANNFLKNADQMQTFQRVEKVADLVQGFESAFGLELLATVHWIVSEIPSIQFTDLVKKVHGWNDHKRQFSEFQIKKAWETLHQKGWLSYVE